MHHQCLDQWRHDHVFGQDRKKAGETRTLVIVGLTLAMMVWETLAGVVYGSMALLADGLHMGSHAMALGITVFAYAYARKNAGNASFSFGTGKVNALGGFAGAILLCVFALYMMVESVGRFMNPVSIAFDGAILVAVIGLAVNGVSAWILKDDGHDHDPGQARSHQASHDHNRRAAYFHVLADALTSLLAIVALLAGKYAGWHWMDPLMGGVGAILVSHWSWRLLKDTASVLLDRRRNDLETAVKDAIEDGDARVSDLHVWAIGPGLDAAIVSLVAHEPATPDVYRRRIRACCRSLVHVTVEPQRCREVSESPSHAA
ncbi:MULTISPECIES: CDF family Co(II)/Ni(II) efflux transporter DmeF [unclassified Modicisalibacter]|uniref:CDF family Co(II)/Ni(II) efflux transporter DmeF n=1 Tax=unclassified Modicisalibacter TaxID=2679913 RepID=UPI001CC8F52E|nr:MULTISPECIES: CDF family Co(II)/Ni(II) efflux transporter DmeF [unclassified Modicisalibacter]MBZ9558461.1 CDF family Co(II)/Ni(II) efflux transporter DmeF [Modicisalibacter sp. R2A 31.J]MBZ9575647.1 CDF family Co(II)/Ni(II) efflux transporter DmeF [Modicisalibacter sp. MOD 31.J]